MIRVTNEVDRQLIEGEWATFQGGELDGKRPKTLCRACRDAIGDGFRQAEVGGAFPSRREGRTAGRMVCFQCYRTQMERERALRAAGQLDTASEARFQTGLPFEPVDRPRLAMLKIEREAGRATTFGTASGGFADRRRQAQLAARRALQRLGDDLTARGVAPRDRAREIAGAIHAAELQLPESWLPFVVSR